GFYFHQALSIYCDLDILVFMKGLNALFAALSLSIFDRILKVRSVEGRSRVLWLLCVGSSWGIMRFATENETYIIPIFLSLLGSLFLAKFYRKAHFRFLWLAGLFTAFAALVHQIHFFWWFGIFVGLVVKERHRKIIYTYSVPALSVPLIYILVYYLDMGEADQSFIEFIFHNYQEGRATFSIDYRNFILTPISFIRTFLQIHGYISSLILQSGLYIMTLMACLICFSFSLAYFPQVEIKWRKTSESFVFAHGLVFAFHLFFAFLSHGNAEFMVMLPFLGVLFLSNILKKTRKLLSYLVPGMFIWNMVFGLIPLSKKDMYGDSMVAKFILDKSESTDSSTFILFNRPRVANILEYQGGQISDEDLFYIVDFEDPMTLRSFIHDRLEAGEYVYTDCLERPNALSRAALLTDKQSNAFRPFESLGVDSVRALSGTYVLSRIMGKKKGVEIQDMLK
ncbi:MAG: hypothetical protein GVX78_01515, partial [Bacteroidetes bacterium]|nr:hypothetical protein [Bacteroidota bacterium]